MHTHNSSILPLLSKRHPQSVDTRNINEKRHRRFELVGAPLANTQIYILPGAKRACGPLFCVVCCMFCVLLMFFFVCAVYAGWNATHTLLSHRWARETHATDDATQHSTTRTRNSRRQFAPTDSMELKRKRKFLLMVLLCCSAGVVARWRCWGWGGETDGVLVCGAQNCRCDTIILFGVRVWCVYSNSVFARNRPTAMIFSVLFFA